MLVDLKILTFWIVGFKSGFEKHVILLVTIQCMKRMSSPVVAFMMELLVERLRLISIHPKENSKFSRDQEKPFMKFHIVRYFRDRKSTRLNSSHVKISYAVFCLKKKKQ